MTSCTIWFFTQQSNVVVISQKTHADIELKPTWKKLIHSEQNMRSTFHININRKLSCRITVRNLWFPFQNLFNKQKHTADLALLFDDFVNVYKWPAEMWIITQRLTFCQHPGIGNPSGPCADKVAGKKNNMRTKRWRGGLVLTEASKQ